MDLAGFDPNAVIGELSRRSLKQFLTHFWPAIEKVPFVDNWHLDCFVDHLHAIREIKNLLITCPPGITKSLLFNVFFPAWFWLHEPQARFLCASYAYGVSERDSINCRKLLNSEQYRACYPDLEIIDNQDTKRHFQNTAGGYRMAISVGGVTTGLKGNFLILDDPHNALDADSDTRKSETVRWFTEAWSNRLADFNRDCRIVIGQRIAKDDLAGFILEHYGPYWVHLNLPWEYRPTSFVSPIGWADPRKKDGEPLWPERFPPREIEQLKKKRANFETQWNQHPVQSEESLFREENFRQYRDNEAFYFCGPKSWAKANCFRVAACDLAASAEKGADYTVILVADLCYTGEIFVVHLLREKVNSTKLVSRIAAIHDAWNPSYFLIEQNAFQKVIIEQCRQEGLPVKGVQPNDDKEIRSIPLQSKFEGHRVFFPLRKPWVEAIKDELVRFPDGRHDDIVDALSWLAIESQKRCKVKARPEEQPPPVKVESEEERWHRMVMADL